MRCHAMLAVTLATAALCTGCAHALRSIGPPDANDLVGTWKVDLRPTPDADPYYQEFVVSGIDSATFTGTFYGTPIENARLNTDWGRVRFAFTTADGSGAYHTTGVLAGDEIRGTTHSLGREFLAVWTAERVVADSIAARAGELDW